ncbi:hypothetical protein E2C01_098433 [Portunus trituberculatus]|uniref:Uncharacterized protein n=1 Tax=Portunus trituberculatus TaxID=210409 RepID=A0A5B7KC29_PORTR|nr:hypothetical protein [Portunus trituberculatus]
MNLKENQDNNLKLPSVRPQEFLRGGTPLEKIPAKFLYIPTSTRGSSRKGRQRR